MKTVIVKTQKQIDTLPDSYTEYTVIEIRSDGVKVSFSKKVANSRVEARENSRVEALGNSSVIAQGNSRVEARENSRVEALGNSRVEARENSSVIAGGNSSVVTWENSSVEAQDFSIIAVFTASVVIKKLLDCSVASLRGIRAKIITKDGDKS